MSTFEPVESHIIIKEFSKLKNGTAIKQDSLLGSLYSYVSNPGETVVLKDKKSFAAFHFNHDDFLHEIDIEKYGWQIYSENNIITLTLIIPHTDGPYIIMIPMDHSIEDNRKLIELIKSKKKIDIHFTGILYGELVKFTSYTFKIPKDITKLLKI